MTKIHATGHIRLTDVTIEIIDIGKKTVIVRVQSGQVVTLSKGSRLIFPVDLELQ